MSDHFTRHLREDFECSIGNYTLHPAVRRRYPPALEQTLANPLGVYVAAEVRDVTDFDDRFDRLWRDVEPSFHLIAVRDAGYLTWRYRDPRATSYVVRSIEEGDRLLGYSVSRVDRGWSSGVDLIASPGRHDIVAALVEDVLESARRARAAGCRCWSLRHHRDERTLRALGFVRAPGEVRLLCRPAGADPPDLRFLREPRPAVHVSYGDSDHV